MDLSDKIKDAWRMDWTDAISEEDVREFIKKLKDKITNPDPFIHKMPISKVNEIIDKLAGEKLI